MLALVKFLKYSSKYFNEYFPNLSLPATIILPIEIFVKIFRLIF